MIFEDYLGREHAYQEINEEDPTEELFKSIVENDEVRKYDQTLGVVIDDSNANHEYKPFADIVPIGCNELRITIPSTAEVKLKPSTLWKFLKDQIHKDLTKFSMPVFANEPCTVLMKAGEVSYFLQDLSKVAKIHDSPTRRMLYLACIYSSAFN